MPEPSPLLAGDPQAVAGYRLLGRLGEGGQGTVFLGRGPDGTKVAVKLLHARLAAEDAARERFVREISAARRVARFSTAQVLDAAVAGARPYVVSEYVEGPSLRELIAAQGPRSGGALDRLAVGTATAAAGRRRPCAHPPGRILSGRRRRRGLHRGQLAVPRARTGHTHRKREVERARATALERLMPPLPGPERRPGPVS